MSDIGSNGEQPTISDEDFDWDRFFREQQEEGFSPEAAADSAAESLQQPPAEELPLQAPDAGEPEARIPTDSDPSEPPSPAEPSPDPLQAGYVEVGGERIPESQEKRVASVYRFLSEYPEEAQQFMGYLQGDYEMRPRGQEPPQPQYDPRQYAPQPEPEPQPQEDWDFVPDSLRQVPQQFQEMQQRLNQYDQYFQQQQAAAAQDSINVAADNFRGRHDVTDEEFNQIRHDAGQLGVAGRIAAEHGGDMTRGAEEALELAYLRNPGFREREAQAQAQQFAQEQQRQQRLGAIGGNGGSAPRTEAPPADDAGRRAAMVQELAQAIDEQRGN